MTNKEAYLFITTLVSLKTSPGTKLEYAKSQTLKNAHRFVEAYNDKIENLNIDFCSTDDKGNIVRDTNGQYLFTKDSQRALTMELKMFMNSSILVSFEIVATSDRKGLSDIQIEYFIETGFIRDLISVA